MLLKAPDDKSALLAELERLAARAAPKQRGDIEEELRALRAGIKGEKEAAYLLDFHLKASRNTAIIHDLRLDLDGRVAQIDHLLLHRTLNVFVLETKHFLTGIRITEGGEFLRWNAHRKAYEGMPSPLAQNGRHIAVLRDAFARIDMPTRLGVRLTPVFLPYVLVSSRAWIARPKQFDSSHVLKADLFSVEDELNKRGLLKGLGHIGRFVASDILRAIGRQLVAMHTPASIDYAVRFGLAPSKGSGSRSAAPENPLRFAGKSSTLPSSLLRLSRPKCSHCGGQALSIQSGRFSYYFKCADCGGNTPIAVGCGKEGHRERIRKDGRTFYRECPACRTRSVFFVNPPA